MVASKLHHHRSPCSVARHATWRCNMGNTSPTAATISIIHPLWAQVIMSEFRPSIQPLSWDRIHETLGESWKNQEAIIYMLLGQCAVTPCMDHKTSGPFFVGLLFLGIFWDKVATSKRPCHLPGTPFWHVCFTTWGMWHSFGGAMAKNLGYYAMEFCRVM